MKGLNAGAATMLLAAVLWVPACRGSRSSEHAPAPDEVADAGLPAEPALPDGAQAISQLGEPLFPPVAPDAVQEEREAQLAEALQVLEADPDDADAIIWAGRRYAYLGRYRQAIATFSRGIETHPDDPRLYRHRGHRYITVREFDRAIADFRKAEELVRGTPDEVEPDGQPNAQGIPTSTLQFNILYHYGLAMFLKGDFEAAEPVYSRCMEVSVHADSKVATAHWWYMTLRRLGRGDDAQALLAGLDLDALGSEVIESGGYLELLRMYARAGEDLEGLRAGLETGTLEGATTGYGVGDFLLYNGDPAHAREIFEGIVEAKDQWAAFGYIAAEADLARMRAREGS